MNCPLNDRRALLAHVADLAAEVDALQHDITRHVAICAEQATELDPCPSANGRRQDGPSGVRCARRLGL